MLDNLQKITGSAPQVRIGGTTANHATFVANQPQAIIQNFAVAGADQPANVTLGPSYLESFKTFDKDTKYTMGITFDAGRAGEDKSVAEAQVFWDGLKNSLYALEVGNEFDGMSQSRIAFTRAASNKSGSFPCRPQYDNVEYCQVGVRMDRAHLGHFSTYSKPPQANLPSWCLCLPRLRHAGSELDSDCRAQPGYR